LDTSLAAAFPRLYAVSMNLDIKVQIFFANGVSSLAYRRALVRMKLEEWNKLISLCGRVVLNEGQYTLVWLLTSLGQFSVKSFYSAMQSTGSVSFKFLWKIKNPLRIKTFLWLVLKKKHSY
jgi:hypothetical protein